MNGSGRARIIRVPFGLGANKHPGLELGPSAVEQLARLRIREFQLDATRASTQVPFRYRLTPDSIAIETPDAHLGQPPPNQHKYASLTHLEAVKETCRNLRELVRCAILEDAMLPLVLGGDHSIAIGSIAGLLEACPDRKVGVIWIDNHADYNTGFRDETIEPNEYDAWHSRPGASKQREGTTVTGHIHGMSLAVATGSGDSELTGIYSSGRFVDPRCIAMLGVRDLDREERDRVFNDGLLALSSRSIQYRGVVDCTRAAILHLQERGVQTVHVSFDIDVLDGSILPGTGTRVPGGLSFREADLMLKLLRDWLPQAGISIGSFDMVEVNPFIDKEARTANLAARLLCTFLGEEILAGETFPLRSATEVPR